MYVELLPLMLHAKFQNRRPHEDFLKVFAIYSHDGLLGHVILTIYINLSSPIPRILHIQFGFDWSSGY